MVDIDGLHELDFTKTLIEDSRNYTQRLLKLSVKQKALVGSPSDEYIYQVLDSFSELIKIAENLDYAEILLNSYSVSQSWRSKYDRNHYFTYNYEMWLINLVRLYERTLILIDSVFWLEIGHKDVTFKTVSQHKKLEGTKTLSVLNKLHGALSQVQGMKNSVFHRYSYTDEELKDVSRFEFLARQSEGEEKESYSVVARWKMAMYTRGKKAEVARVNSEAIKATSVMLNTLLNEYIRQRDSKR